MIISTKCLLYQKIIFLALLIGTSVAQDSSYQVKINLNPDNHDYWWLNNNNNGKDFNKKIVDFRWGFENKSTEYQIMLSNGLSLENKLYIGESFIKKKLSKNVSIKLGKYYRDFSLYLNDNLSSGSMLISHNAEPMPKIGLSGLLPYNRNKNISFDWGISHGKFDKNEYYSKAPFLHEKFIYINFKKNNQQFSFGLVHEAVWSGTTIQGYHKGRQPGEIEDFFKVFISADGPLREGEVHANALGNHLGIWDFYYQKTNDNQILKLYYQHYFEDTSSLRFANKIDGLWGIELKNYFPNTDILLEYLNTSNCCINPPYQSDQYYYNYQYRAGWSFKNNILGNPFVNSETFNSSGVAELSKVLHIGLTKKMDSNSLLVQASRDTRKSDLLKYRINFNKNINNTVLINIMIVGNGDNYGFGLGASYQVE
jgi:hypothetical protein